MRPAFIARPNAPAGAPPKVALAAVAFALLLYPGPAAAVTVADPSTLWVNITYTGVFPDFLADQQTGQAESDIVGDEFNGAFYTAFDNGGTPLDLEDGTLFFRLRVGAEKNPSGFSNAAFVGIDANEDGEIEAFVGVDNSGSGDHVGIWNAGTGANTSPNTTSILSPPITEDPLSIDNYSWRPVDILTDGITDDDLDGGTTGTDYYVSFAIPFGALVNYYDTNEAFTIDELTPLQYVAATATQDNSLNQDLNGVDGGVNSVMTWEELGGFTDPFTFSGQAAPEPSSLLLVLLGLVPFAQRRR